MIPARALPPHSLASLLLAVFVVWFGYSVLLPVLPGLVERAGGTLDSQGVARHTGYASALYTLGLFLFAPLWGWLSDRTGRRSVLAAGLLGYAVSLVSAAAVGGLAGVYAERFLSGLFASAISPVASAVIGDFAPNEQWRAQRLAWLGMAATAGLFLGPIIGAAATMQSGPSLAFFATAGVAAATAALCFAVVPPGNTSREPRSAATQQAGRKTLFLLLALALIVGVGVGVFEVGLALRSDRALNMTAGRLAWLFAECSIVMFVAQAIVFSPLFRPGGTWRTISPSLLVMAVAIAALPWSRNFTHLSIVVALVAASGGILVPVITYWVSLAAGARQGADLGSQAAAASLGQAIGSALVGQFYGFGLLPSLPFVLAGVLLGLIAAVDHKTVRRLIELQPRLS